jgi:putative ABC transport system ATP-binding protein
LLRGNNTTISIAHRLSTIKRSDRVIVIGSDGRVAEEGSYSELSKREGGAFSQLMQWQMSGDTEPPKQVEPRPTVEEEIEYDIEQDEGEVGEEDGKQAEKDPNAAR